MKATAELTERLRSGDQEALFSLMAIHYNDLFRYGIRFTADKDLTKDIIGQFFLHIWDHRDKFCAAQHTEAYLLVSFKRFLINYLQKISRQLNFSEEEASCVEYSYEDYIIAWQENEDIRTSLSIAVQALPERQRELVRLRFYEQLSYKEIARKTSLSPRTIYNKLHEALKRLRTNTSLVNIHKLR